MKCQLEFLTTPTADTAGTCLLLHFDNQRYLIGNAHEGLQRVMVERGKKLNKVTDIFLTGKTEWKNTGGLIGVILTLADSLNSAVVANREKLKVSKDKESLHKSASTDSLHVTEQKKLEGKADPGRRILTIHGTHNVTHTLATARRFVFRKGMPVRVNEIEDNNREGELKPTWSDDNIMVWALPIKPKKVDSYQSGTSSSPSSKRTYDQFADETQITPEDLQNRQLRRGVVGDMFDSDWHLDALFETPLAKVSLPATLFVRNQTTNKLENYTGPIPGGVEPVPDINVLVRKPWPGALVTHLPPTTPSATALSYIVRLYPRRGKFQPKKAIALGVPSGPLFSLLASGVPVQSKDGKTVRPEDVLGPTQVGSGFAVVDLPSREYVANLLSRGEWKTSTVMDGLEAIVWILGRGVIYDEDLQKFISEFSHLKHIISSKDCCPNYLALDSAAAAAIRLYQLDPDRYTVPNHDNTAPFRSADGSPASLLRDRWVPAKRGLQMLLAPDVKILEHCIIPPLNTAELLQKMPKDALSLAEAVRSHLCSKDIEIANSLQGLPSPDSEIIFLGTGSSLPSRYRNVSATLLRVPGIGSYLFDCGESTLGQLSRMYDSEELAEVLQDLKMIWISHLHADHHLGTTSVIKAWYRAVYGDQQRDISFITPSVAEQLEDPDRYLIGQKRLFITSDKAMNDWLAEYASVEDFGYDKLVPLNVWAAKNGEPESTSYWWDKTSVVFNEAMRKATGLIRLAAANVKHCHGSKGVSVTFSTGLKFTYSGDCRPSHGLMEIGKGSTVLLHEATFDDELRGDAKAKLHSTISEAIGVGGAMGAQRVLLTHFSQRYQKLPIMDTSDDAPIELEDDEGDLIDPMAGMDTQELQSTSLGEAVESDIATDDLLLGKGPQGFKDGPKIRKVHQPLAKRQGQDMKVGVGFDFMRVKVKDIAILEKFTPALLKLYEEAPVTSSDGENDEKKLERLKEQKQKQQEKRIGGGRMGRVKKTEKEKESMRNGIGLFDDNRGLEKISAASQRVDL